MGESLIVLILIGIAGVYFIPTIISTIRRTKRDAGIFLLNLLLGWTFIGWVGALVWSISDNTRKEE